eukprot:gene8253-25644_t
MASNDRWLPLESNPDVMNKFIHGMGVPADHAFCDIYGTDEALLGMVPQPCKAVLLLFPSQTQTAHKAAEAEHIEKDGQDVAEGLFYMDQTIGNACGTIGLLHAIANNTDTIALGDGFLKTFIEETKTLSPEERGAKLEGNEGITEAHEVSAQEGQTAAPEPEEQVLLHFICFTKVDGTLYELDGCKATPINHGSTTDDTFLKDAAAICKGFIDRGQESEDEEARRSFSMVALCKV